MTLSSASNRVVVLFSDRVYLGAIVSAKLENVSGWSYDVDAIFSPGILTKNAFTVCRSISS